MKELKDRWIAETFEGFHPYTERFTVLRGGRVGTAGGRIWFTNVTRPKSGSDEAHAFDAYEEAEALADKVQKQIGKVGKCNFPVWILVDEINRRLRHLDSIGLLETGK